MAITTALYNHSHSDQITCHLGLQHLHFETLVVNIPFPRRKTLGQDLISVVNPQSRRLSTGKTFFWQICLCQVHLRGFHTADYGDRWATINKTHTNSNFVHVLVTNTDWLLSFFFILQLSTSFPWELLFVDDLSLINDVTLQKLVEKLLAWKKSIDSKGLKVNMPKTRVMPSDQNMDVLKDSGKFPCAVCSKGVERNSIYCSDCSHWVHNKCSGIKSKLPADPQHICLRSWYIK